MSGPVWPADARAAVSVTFDNLGEAAEIELGLRAADAPLGAHYSVTDALPIVLAELAAAGLEATFFIEGLNAEIYPEAIATIDEAGHEIGYHAWRHEDWSTLDRDAERANLERGLAAFEAIGVEIRGFRPPGGRITTSTLELLERRGLRYCSPAGSGVGLDRVALLPFSWPTVDVFHVLPAFAALREHLGQAGESGGADAIQARMLQSIDETIADGGHLALVLHTWMIELERDAVHEVLARIQAAVDAGELWSARCCEVAAWIGEHGESFAVAPRLDETSWTMPS